MKTFAVQIGRVVREQQTVLVSVPDNADEAWVREQLHEVYDAAEGGPYDDRWEPDFDWGCEESDSHAVIGEVSEAEAQACAHKISLLEEDES